MEPGLVLPVVITAFADKSLHLHPQDAAGVGADQEGRSSSTRARPRPHLDKVGKLTRAQIEEIAKAKQRT